MGCQTANLGVQVLNLSLVGGPGFGHGVALLEYVGQSLDGSLLPFTQDVGVDAILGCELAEGLGFLQQLQHDLGFEGGTVRLFHVAILPNPGLLAVQILGSTILSLLHMSDALY